VLSQLGSTVSIGRAFRSICFNRSWCRPCSCRSESVTTTTKPSWSTSPGRRNERLRRHSSSPPGPAIS